MLEKLMLAMAITEMLSTIFATIAMVYFYFAKDDIMRSIWWGIVLLIIIQHPYRP